MPEKSKKRGICLDCDKQACFNLPDTKPPIYCSNHKKINMINVKEPRCIEDNCSTRPNYGLPNGKPTHCSTHKKENMINLYSKKCLFENCMKEPNFGNPNGKPEYCTEHKKPNMINLKCKTCIAENCTKQPSFGLPNGKVEYCATHKLPNMINLKDNLKIESCWKINSKNIIAIKDKKEWTTRLNKLKKTITYWMKNTSDKIINVVELFYDY